MYNIQHKNVFTTPFEETQPGKLDYLEPSKLFAHLIE